MSSSIPSTQHAVVVKEVGGPEVLEYHTDVAIPAPKEGQVLVKNTVSGVNFVDTYYRSGFYKSEKPEILGREGAGVIVALGPETAQYNFAVGDRVLWLGIRGYAQYSGHLRGRSYCQRRQLQSQGSVPSRSLGVQGFPQRRRTSRGAQHLHHWRRLVEGRE